MVVEVHQIYFCLSPEWCILTVVKCQQSRNLVSTTKNPKYLLRIHVWAFVSFSSPALPDADSDKQTRDTEASIPLLHLLLQCLLAAWLFVPVSLH